MQSNGSTKLFGNGPKRNLIKDIVEGINPSLFYEFEHFNVVSLFSLI